MTPVTYRRSYESSVQAVRYLAGDDVRKLLTGVKGVELFSDTSSFRNLALGETYWVDDGDWIVIKDVGAVAVSDTEFNFMFGRSSGTSPQPVTTAAVLSPRDQRVQYLKDALVNNAGGIASDRVARALELIALSLAGNDKS